MVIEANPSDCPLCGSLRIEKHGFTKNKYKWIQRYTCQNCGKMFQNSYHRHRKSIVRFALICYLTGQSYVQISYSIRYRFNVKIWPQSIGYWVRHYLEGLKPFRKMKRNLILSQKLNKKEKM